MAESFTIRSSKYCREFDGSDNPCCWQVDRVAEDVEEILSRLGIEFESIYEDWGAAFSWSNRAGVNHGIMISCVDTAQAKYEFDLSADKRRWLVFRSAVPVEQSDFAVVAPLLQQLGSNS